MVLAAPRTPAGQGAFSGARLDLDTALATRATQLAALGSADSLDVRRSVALGDLARRQLSLDLDLDQTHASDATNGEASSPSARSVRLVVLYVHLTQAAVTSRGPGLHLARVENTRTFIDAEQVRAWCGHPDAQVLVKPVLDLAEHLHVSAYEVPDRLVEQATLVDLQCVFPWCTRPARRLRPDGHRTDCDHTVEFARGGTTCSCNIAPLCRRHHRLKTHTTWGYTVIERGTYVWTSPHGYAFLRDHHGTLDVSPDRRPPPGSADPIHPTDDPPGDPP